ncbi:MAG: hypothetical protein ABSB35_30530 [Bryobacteraceae bacterium]
MNELVEEYLGNSRKRQDISRYRQHRARTDFSFSALCRLCWSMNRLGSS